MYVVYSLKNDIKNIYIYQTQVHLLSRNNNKTRCVNDKKSMFPRRMEKSDGQQRTKQVTIGSDRRWLTHFEMETCYDGELLHCQLFGGLLVTMATAALDFGTAS